MTSFLPRKGRAAHRKRLQRTQERTACTGSGAGGGLSPSSASLNTRQGGEGGEHNPKFSNGEEDECQHLLPAWKSSWAAHEAGTSRHHQEPGGEAGSDKDGRPERTRRDGEGKEGKEKVGQEERDGDEEEERSVALSCCWNTVTAAPDRLI